MRITRHSVAHYLENVGEEVFGLNDDGDAPHFHMLHTPGHYAFLDLMRPDAADHLPPATNDCRSNDAESPSSPSSLHAPPVVEDE